MRDCPSVLLMVMTKQSLTGNSRHICWWIMGILPIDTISFMPIPIRVVAPMTYNEKVDRAHYTTWKFRFSRSMMNILPFTWSFMGRNTRKRRKSVGFWITSEGFWTVLLNLYSWTTRICCNSFNFISSIASFFGASITCSWSH